MNIIDTHQHLWDLRRFPYSWCASIPALNRSFGLSDYAQATAGCDIRRTVFVECDVDDPHQLDEASHVQSLASGSDLIAGIVAGCRPERDNFERHIDALVSLPMVKGVRRVLHPLPDAVSQPELFARNVRSLAKRSLSFDLCVLARQLSLALSLVERCPEVQFILDHCGNPDIRAGAFEGWQGHIAQLASHPNVVCKISGLVVRADGDKPGPLPLQAWVDHVIEHFGWDRVMWGSDWPVCTLACEFKQWLEIARSVVSQATPLQQEKFFWRNAQRVYRLAEIGTRP